MYLLLKFNINKLCNHSFKRILTKKYYNYSKQWKTNWPTVRRRERITSNFAKRSGLCFFGSVLLVVNCKQAVFENEHENEEDIFRMLYSDDAQFDWSALFSLLRPHIWRLIVAIIAALIVAATNVQLPMQLGTFIDILNTKISSTSAINADFWSQIQKPVRILVSSYCLQAFCTFVYIDLLSTVGENLAECMKMKLFETIMQQQLAFFDTHRTGELIDRLTSDVQEFKSSFKICVSQGLRTTTQIAGCLTSLILLSPELTALMALVLPVIIASGTYLGSLLRKLSKEAQQQVASSTIVAEEVMSNVRTVRAFAMESYECERFRQQLRKCSNILKRLGYGIALFQAGAHLFLNGVVLGTLCAGGYLLSRNRFSAGHLMSFLVAVQTIQRSLVQLSLLFGNYVRGHAAGARIFQLMKLEPKVPLAEIGTNSAKSSSIIPYHALVADVDFENVTFRYPTRPEQTILKDFNLKIGAGKVVAIVGSSGNGKSTVASLLLKFYEANSGRIKIDGRNIKDLDENWLRGRVIGIINQEPVLFAGTIKQNIKYGNQLATDEQVYEAARLANADEFIRSLPNGYETLVGERGVAVSGGQKQRIAIARALIKQPSILILDEATSALDTISEKQVQESLESIMRGKTVLIIAHRLSTVKNADLIVVLHAGQIVEVGKHDDLIKKKSYYWDLMKQQQAERKS